MITFPTPFGRYLLLKKIASGGMAEIFKAKLIGVEGFEKIVVIKRILPFWSQRPEFIAMLVDEAKVLVHLNHPNIVQVYELGREGENYFIAMEFVEGVDLRQLLRKSYEQGRAIPPAIAIALLREALQGLHYAHERSLKGKGALGIVHRDVSPQNILISFEGKVKVTDFGIAKAMTQTHETQTGVLKGKYAYMSPEQAQGKPLDARSDLFSAGIILYEMLMRERLFAGSNDLETLDRVRRSQISWSKEKLSLLFPGVEAVLRRALAKNPEQRFLSGEAFASALEDSVPSGNGVSSREISDFLFEVFPESRTELEREESQATEKFGRRTRITPSDSHETVSVWESITEKPGFPFLAEKSESVVPKKGAGIKWSWATGLPLFFFLVLGLVLWKVSPWALGDKTPKAEGPVSAPWWDQTKLVLNSRMERKYPPVIIPVEPNVQKAITMKKAPPKLGSIRVNAVPWGRVVMAGFIQGSETPVGKSGIPEGRYRVQVSNPALGKTVSSTAVIRPGRTTRCQADFEGTARIHCQ